MATVANLEIDQGSDWVSEITLENDDGTPMQLQGFTVHSQFRKSFGSLIGYSFVASILSTTQGKISLSLSGVTSSGIKHGRYLYDIEIISETNVKTRVVQGIVTINPEITRIP